MEGSVGAPPQRVCPNCARISWATGPQCPYCAEQFRQRRVTPRMLVLTAVGILVVVGLMFVYSGRELDRRVNDRVAEIQKEFDASLNRFRDEVRKEVQASGGTGGIATPFPAATPFPTATVDPGLTETPTPAPTASPEPTETASPSATIQP